MIGSVTEAGMKQSRHLQITMRDGRAMYLQDGIFHFVKHSRWQIIEIQNSTVIVAVNCVALDFCSDQTIHRHRFRHSTKLSWNQICSLPLPILRLFYLQISERRRRKTKECESIPYNYSPTESPQMQLSVERSDLCLIKEHRNYLLHECVLIEYPERSSVWQPRDCLGKFGNSICELEHSIELDRELGLWPSRRGRARGSLFAAVHSFFRGGTSNGHHLFLCSGRIIMVMVMQ